MALETERCSPNNASSPGPTDNNRRPGLDDCSDHTKERSSLQQTTATAVAAATVDDTDPATVSAMSAFRPVRQDATDITPAPQTPAAVDDGAVAAQQQLLACSKPLSICSPLQNKTPSAASIAVATDKTCALPQQENYAAPPIKKKPAHGKPSVDVGHRWVQQQHHQQPSQNDPAAQHVTAAAAVEYTMAMAAAAAAAGHVVPPNVFPFNSWMYRFNLLPIMPAAAEYFREMHGETDDHQMPAILHQPHGFLRHQADLSVVQQLQLQQQYNPLQHPSLMTRGLRPEAQQVLPIRPPSPAAIAPFQQPPPPPPPPPPSSSSGPPSTGYASRPTSTASGSSSDASSSAKNYGRSPSPRSPSPAFRLTFSVDNILRPEFGTAILHHTSQPQQQQLHHHHHGRPSHHPYAAAHHRRPSSASPPPPPPLQLPLQHSAAVNCSKLQVGLLPPPQPLAAASKSNASKRPTAADKAKRKTVASPTAAAAAAIVINNKPSAINGLPLNKRQPVDDAAMINNNNNSSNNNNNNSTTDDDQDSQEQQQNTEKDGDQLWPAWVYCTRYSDRPSSGKF